MATRAGSSLCAASRGQDGPLRHNATSARRTLSGEEVILFAPSFDWAGAAQGITVIHVARRGVAGRFSRGGVVAGDFGGVGGRSGDTVSAESGEARSQSWIRSRECGEREERVRSHGGQAIGEELLTRATGRDRVNRFHAETAFPQQLRTGSEPRGLPHRTSRRLPQNLFLNTAEY